jgi:ADP-heptose:LPS heptosyltransferase
MKYLFFNHDGKLGDAIVHTILVKGISSNDLNNEIHVTASGYSKEFWRLDKRINSIYSLNKPTWFEVLKLGLTLKKEKFDYLILYQRNKSEKIKFLVKLLKPKKTIFADDNDNEHVSIREHKILEKIFDKKLNLRYSIPDLSLSNPIDFSYCLINLFSGINEQKRSIQKFAAFKLILRILNQFPQKKIVLICEDRNNEFCESIKQVIDLRFNGQLIIKNCSGSGLKGLIEACGSAEIVISPDTSLIHLASALGRPVIGIYQRGESKSTVWGPLVDKYAVIIGKNEFDIHNFSVKQVVKAYQDLIFNE